MPFKTSPETDNDLIKIYEYGFLKFGEAQAEKYFSELQDCFQLLNESPFICRERDEFNPPVRICHHGRHLIIYLIMDDYILIVRVLHERMDVQRRLFFT